MTDITVSIATIPPRRELLERAISSAWAQTHKPVSVVVAIDTHKEGAASTKSRAMELSDTTWTAFLDDDDFFAPIHLETLASVASDDVDVVYSAPLVIDQFGQEIPLQKSWGNFGQDFDPDLLVQESYIGMWSMVRTELAHEIGGFLQPEDSPYDDWNFFRAMLNAGARFVHVPKQTYVWTHIPNIGNGLGNTSGKADRWS